jgi:threonine synthase
MTYYAHAALTHWRLHAHVLDFVIPTGNLGNALGCLLARALGLPIGEVVLATNANRVLADFFSGDAYAPRASITTLANAMDVGNPSNFERLRWLVPDAGELRATLRAQAVDDDAIRETVRHSLARYGVLACPHTATALRVVEHVRERGDLRDIAIVATAHPAKFDSVIEPLIDTRIDVPAGLAALLARPARAEPLAPDAAALRERLMRLAADDRDGRAAH